MKARNKHIVSDDIEYLKELQKEYQDYGGWDTELVGNELTIFALHRKYQRRKEAAAQKKSKPRDKRSEKFERRDK
jgi:ABC-type molybdate transport system substrate-binding protein